MPTIDLTKRHPKHLRRQAKGESANTAATQAAQIPQGIVQRAADPQSLQPTDMLYLQRAIGNGALNHMLSQGRAAKTKGKLTVGASDDRFEREADHVSQQVTSIGPDHSVQRSESEAQVGAEGGAISGDLETRIAKARGGGSSAPTMVRRAVEEQTGADFSNVRVHNNKDAHSISAQLGAKAATYGKDIFLARDQSPHDVQLMAHELTHTMQQGAVKTGEIDAPAKDSRTPAIQLKRRDHSLQQDYEWQRVQDLQNLTTAQLKAGNIAFKTAAYALHVFNNLLLLPLGVIDHLTVTDLHLKDFFNFVRSGKTRRQREKDPKWREKKIKKLNKRGKRGKTYSNFKLSSRLARAKLKRNIGRSGLRGYVAGQFSHKGLYGKDMNATVPGLNSEFNPVKQLLWGAKDLRTESRLRKQALRQKLVEQQPPVEQNDDLQNDNIPDVNVQENNVQENIVQDTDLQHEDGTNSTSEGGGHPGYLSEEDAEFIRQLDEVMAEIDKVNEGRKTD